MGEKWFSNLKIVSIITIISIMVTVGVSMTEILPKYDIKIKYEQKVCMDSIISVEKYQKTFCPPKHNMIFAQSLIGDVYVLCVCGDVEVRGTDMGTFPLLPTLPDKKQDVEVEKNLGVIPIPSTIPTGTFM